MLGLMVNGPRVYVTHSYMYAFVYICWSLAFLQTIANFVERTASNYQNLNFRVYITNHQFIIFFFS